MKKNEQLEVNEIIREELCFHSATLQISVFSYEQERVTFLNPLNVPRKARSRASGLECGSP